MYWSRLLVVLALLASSSALLGCPQPAFADIPIEKPKPQPRPPKPQPPLPKPLPPLPPPGPEEQVRTFIVGLSGSVGVCLLGLWLARRNRHNRVGSARIAVVRVA
jgi:hypothetical protein